MPTLEAIRFDTTGWQPVSRDRHLAVWRNEFADELFVLLNFGPPGLPAVGDPRPSILAATGQLGDAAYQVLAVDRRAVAGGSAVVSLIRTRRGTGWRYGAAVILPFATFSYTLLVLADEHGVTGVRETLAHIWERVTGDGPGEPSAEREQMIDAALPTHPQARVRLYLDELLGSLALGTELSAAVAWPPGRMTTAGGVLEVRDGSLLRRNVSGRLVGRLPLAAVRRLSADRLWSAGELGIGVGGTVCAVLAFALLGGCWGTGVALLAGFVGLLGFATARATSLVVETPAGTFRWAVFQPPWVVDGLLEYWRSLAEVQPEDAPCPPSS